jgi:hypothetical protein
VLLQALTHVRTAKLLFAFSVTGLSKRETLRLQEILLNVEIASKILDDFYDENTL